MDPLDLVLAGLPLNARIVPAMSKDDMVAMAPPPTTTLRPPAKLNLPAMTPEQQAAVNAPEPSAPLDALKVPSKGPQTYEQQYRDSVATQVPGRPMSSYGVAPVRETPEYMAAMKTKGTPTPTREQYRPGFWRTLLGSLSAGAMAYGGNPNAGLIADQAINAPYYRAVDEWTRNQKQASDILAEQDKQYGNESANWRNFLNLSSREDAINERERDSIRRGEDRDRALDLREQQLGKTKEPSMPKTYEDAVSQWALETDPKRKAALKQAMDEMRNTEIRKFQYKEGGDSDKVKRGSPYQFSRVQRDMNTDLQKLEREYRKGSGRFDGLDPSSDEAKQVLTDEKQKIQDNYEQQIVNLGGEAQHYEYPDSNQKPTAKAAPSAPAKSAPAQTKVLDPSNPEHLKIARDYLAKAGGDKNKARQLAKADGYSF